MYYKTHIWHYRDNSIIRVCYNRDWNSSNSKVMVCPCKISRSFRNFNLTKIVVLYYYFFLLKLKRIKKYIPWPMLSLNQYWYFLKYTINFVKFLYLYTIQCDITIVLLNSLYIYIYKYITNHFVILYRK